MLLKKYIIYTGKFDRFLGGIQETVSMNMASKMLRIGKNFCFILLLSPIQKSQSASFNNNMLVYVKQTK